MYKYALTFVFSLSLFWAAAAQMSREDYIDKYKDIAMANMQEFKIPASITLAQAVLESNNGNSDLASRSNNHFGIKCHSDWTGKKTYHDDDKKGECFRVYNKVEDSYADHSEFLQKTRYAKCFELDIMDYKSWAKELKNAGYATNPKYPALLIKIIEDNELYKYDQLAMGNYKPEKKQKDKTKKVERHTNDDLKVIDLSTRLVVQKSPNKIKYVVAEEGQTPEEIAEMFDLGSWQITSYNDVSNDKVFNDGDVVYLQPKRRKAAVPYHEVTSDDETLESVSQQYGIKLHSLRWKNRLKKGDQIHKGMKLYLQKRKPDSAE